MKNITTSKAKGFEDTQSHPILDRLQGYKENVLKPVTLSGVVAPCNTSFGRGRKSRYKLVSYDGLDYLIVTDSEWRNVLSRYCWKEVKVIGLLNISNMTLIPQKVYPKGPTDEKENVIDLAAWKCKSFVNKLINNVNDLVLVPIAVLAVMVS